MFIKMQWLNVTCRASFIAQAKNCVACHETKDICCMNMIMFDELESYSLTNQHIDPHTEGWEGGGAPKDFTKPQQTIQSPSRLYKAPKD